MTPEVERVSAKIYSFPVRPRLRLEVPAEPVHGYCAHALDSCWYHDDAVRQEPKPPRGD
jgi:hypothetical protein